MGFGKIRIIANTQQEISGYGWRFPVYPYTLKSLHTMPNNNDLQEILQSIKNATELQMQIENVYSDFWGTDDSETSDITEKIYYAWADMKEACERYIAHLEDIKTYNEPF